MFPARMLLVTAGSKESAPAARVAVELANGTGSELHVAHVISTKPQRPYPHRGEKGRREALLDAVRVAALALLEEKIRQVDERGAWWPALTMLRESPKKRSPGSPRNLRSA
jgi:nucleotide-binding universal stress UspA family protein